MVCCVFACFLGVMLGMDLMAMGDVGVMASLFLIACGVMFGRCTMMLRGMLVMLSCF